MHSIVDNVVLKLLSHHAELSTDVNLRQKQAIQLLFDVKYATLLMVPRENRALTEKSNDVCNNLVSKVDPFDLDVFYPYIYLNVKKAVQRSLVSPSSSFSQNSNFCQQHFRTFSFTKFRFKFRLLNLLTHVINFCE